MQNINKFIKIHMLIGLIILVVPSSIIGSYSLKLTDNFVQPSQGMLFRTMTIQNSSNEMIPITIDVFERKKDKKGKEIQIETDDILVDPPQILLQSGVNMIVNVQWQGDHMIPAEKAYRIIIKQVQVSSALKGKKKGLNIGTSTEFIKSFYAYPENPIPLIVLKKVNRLSSLSGNTMEIHLANEGTQHKAFNYIEMEYPIGSGISGKYKIKLSKVKPLKKGLNLFPGEMYIGTINWPAEIPLDATNFRLVNIK